MSQPDNTPNWLAWIAPALAALGALWAFMRRFFSYITREEFETALDKRHEENRQVNEAIFRKLDSAEEARNELRTEVGRIAQDVAYLRGKGR